MSLWYFLSDWFGGIPTLGTWFKRSMINSAWALAIIMAMAVFQAPFEHAAVLFFGVVIGNFVTFFVYQRQQRDRTRD
jgi:chromate transport protein ChrA